MRKWIAVILAALLLSGAFAAAEGTTEQTEPILERHYNAEAGYMVSYDGNEFVLGEQYGRDRFTVFGDENAFLLMNTIQIRAEQVEAFLLEAVGGFGADAVVGEPTNKLPQGEADAVIASVQAKEEGVVYRFYLMYTPAEEAAVVEMLCMTAEFPEAQEAAYGARFDALVESIVLNVPEALYEGRGWQMSYPTEIVRPEEIYGKDGFQGLLEDASLMIVESGISPELMPDLLDEVMGGYTGEYAVSEQTERMVGETLVVRWVEAELEGRTERYYAIWPVAVDEVYCATASYPTASAGLYGGVFDSMIDSFEVKDAQP